MPILLLSTPGSDPTKVMASRQSETWRQGSMCCRGSPPLAMPARAEDLGEPVEVHLLGGGEPVRHHDGGHRTFRSVRPIQPAAQGHAIFGSKVNVISHVLSSLVVVALLQRNEFPFGP